MGGVEVKAVMGYLWDQYEDLLREHGHKVARMNRKELAMTMYGLAGVIALAQQLSRIADTLEEFVRVYKEK